jgi:hypothetical protein
MHNLLYHSVTPAFCPHNVFDEFRMFLRVNCDYFLKQHQPIDLCKKEVVFFQVGTEFLNIIKTTFGFGGGGWLLSDILKYLSRKCFVNDMWYLV